MASSPLLRRLSLTKTFSGEVFSSRIKAPLLSPSSASYYHLPDQSNPPPVRPWRSQLARRLQGHGTFDLSQWNIHIHCARRLCSPAASGGTATAAPTLDISTRKEGEGAAFDDIQAESADLGPSTDPVKLHRALRSRPQVRNPRSVEAQAFARAFGWFARSGWAADQALAVYIPHSFFPTAASRFGNFFFTRSPPELLQHFISLGPSMEAGKVLFPLFAEFCLEEFPDEIREFRKLVESADLRDPHEWYPFTRAMKRKIIYHCGPTNSGKTYNALQRFMEADTGVYCSPLRLLAMEISDKVNSLGIYCNLITGQEKKIMPFAKHIACTVEMVSTDESYDVAVIDEIQMAADSTRGHAWTRALLGLKADEIHLCGDPSMLDIVRRICQRTGDELIEHNYQRFKPLVVEAKTLLGDLKNVQSGDCIVAFSRREIFEVKLAIEKFTIHKCCVIYGALPPETRREQANLFNEDDNEFDILVASDAVGMGLNLNIRRVVFYTLSKYNGDKLIPVPASQVKQIAGRAGRRGCRYPDGLVTTSQPEDLDYLIRCLEKPFEEVKTIGLFPCFEQVQLFAAQFPDASFPRLLEKFRETSHLDSDYFLCHIQHVMKVANMLEKVPNLSLEDRFNFCFAPVNIRDPKAMYYLMRFCLRYSQNLPVNLAMGLPKESARNDSELLDLETKHQVLSMYLWLSQQFSGEKFPFKHQAELMATNIVSLLGESLKKVSWKPQSRTQHGSKHEKELDLLPEFNQSKNTEGTTINNETAGKGLRSLVQPQSRTHGSKHEKELDLLPEFNQSKNT